MTNDEKEAKKKSGYAEKIDFDEIDKEVGLGDILKDKDHRYMKYLKNVLFVLLPVVIGFTLFGASFKIGEKIFFVYKTAVKDSLQNSATQNSKEMPDVAVVPKADKAGAGEVKSGAKESTPVKIVEPVSDQVEKVSNPVMEKNMVQPVQKIVAPVAKVEKPVAVAEPEITVPSVKPATVASTVKPMIKPPKQVPKQKTAVKATKKLKEYKVVAASFSIEANADNLINQLKAENYGPIVVQANISKGQYYRVIVGSYSSLSEAHDKIAELKKFDLQPFCIVE